MRIASLPPRLEIIEIELGEALKKRAAVFAENTFGLKHFVVERTGLVAIEHGLGLRLEKLSADTGPSIDFSLNYRRSYQADEPYLAPIIAATSFSSGSKITISTTPARVAANLRASTSEPPAEADPW
jgi:hypothetical protein